MMQNNVLVKIAVVLLFMFSISGCGSDVNSNTNGQLTLVASATDSGAGSTLLSATATIVPGSTKTTTVTPGLAGADVNFTYSQYGTNSSGSIEVLVNQTSSVATNSLGVAKFNYVFAPSIDMATTIQITAKYDGIVSETFNIPVPKYVPVL